jgi:hypothetical protein
MMVMRDFLYIYSALSVVVEGTHGCQAWRGIGGIVDINTDTQYIGMRYRRLYNA